MVAHYHPKGVLPLRTTVIYTVFALTLVLVGALYEVHTGPSLLFLALVAL